jgi:hypothetical protein
MIPALVTAAIGLIDKWIPDADKKAELAQDLATLAEKQAHEIALAQIEVNKEEAKSQGIFKGGWRPFLGWVCGVAFAYHFVMQPLLVFILNVYGIKVDLPEFDMSSLLTVLGGMLGLGGLRTFEKYKGVSK